MNTVTRIEDLAIESEPLDDMLMQAFTKLARRYKDMNHVNSDDPNAQDVLTYLGLDTWGEVIEQRDELGLSADILSLFDAAPEAELKATAITAARGKKLETQRDALVAKVKAASAELDKVVSRVAELDKKLSELEVVITTSSYGFMEGDKEKERAALNAKAAALELKASLAPMIRKIRKEKAKLVCEVNVAEARVRTYARADSIISVNTGDAIADAGVYAKVAGNCIWSSATISNAIVEARLQLDADRLSASASAYDSIAERVDRLESSRNRMLDLYAACETQFEATLESLPDATTNWVPSFPFGFHKELLAAQAKINLAAAKRAQDRSAALARAREEGFY